MSLLCRLQSSPIVRTVPKIVAAHGVRPLAVGLYDKLGARFLTTGGVAKKPRRDDDLLSKTHSDAFDESDALEAGKKKMATPAKPTYPASLWNSSPFQDIDGFFSRDPFFRSPFFHDDPFFSRSHPFASSSLFRQDFSRSDPWSNIMPILRDFPRRPGLALLRSSPGYEVNEADGSITINVDVPKDLTASEMKVEVELDGTLLHLSGKKEYEKDGPNGTTKVLEFHKRFGIGPHLDVENITANFSDGVLVISAPKVDHVEEAPKKMIHITEEPHLPSDEEIVQKSFSDQFDESDWLEEGKVGKKAIMASV